MTKRGGVVSEREIPGRSFVGAGYPPGMSGLLPAVPGTAESVAFDPSVVTPLGVLRFDGTVDYWRLPTLPRTVRRLPGGDLLFRWEHEIAVLELLLRRLEPPSFEGMLPLADCWGAVWRVTALRPLSRVELSASFHAVPEGVQSGYDGAQALAAVSLWNTETLLTLGGPDEEDICSRAEYDADLPGGGPPFSARSTNAHRG